MGRRVELDDTSIRMVHKWYLLHLKESDWEGSSRWGVPMPVGFALPWWLGPTARFQEEPRDPSHEMHYYAPQT